MSIEAREQPIVELANFQLDRLGSTARAGDIQIADEIDDVQRHLRADHLFGLERLLARGEPRVAEDHAANTLDLAASLIDQVGKFERRTRFLERIDEFVF